MEFLWFSSICNHGTIWYYINKKKLILRPDSTSASILVDCEVEWIIWYLDIHFWSISNKLLQKLLVYCTEQHYMADLYIICNVQALLGRFISQLTAGQWISINFSTRTALPRIAQYLLVDDRNNCSVWVTSSFCTNISHFYFHRSLGEILSEREAIANELETTLDAATDPWGIKVERVEIKDVRLPLQLQRAMAAEAEASREAKAKVSA